MEKLTTISNETNLIEIKKSKFYGYAFAVMKEEDISSIITMLKKEHKEAKHICYAYILSSPLKEKCFDDGEPNGTAGLPILTTIKRKGLTNLIILIVRYFGGIKLGAGGLTRAYANTALDLLNKCKLLTYEKNYVGIKKIQISELKIFEKKYQTLLILSKKFEDNYVLLEISSDNIKALEEVGAINVIEKYIQKGN